MKSYSVKIFLFLILLSTTYTSNINSLYASSHPPQIYIQYPHTTSEINFGKTPVKQINSHIFIPLRIISESLGNKVEYKNKKIYITNEIGTQVTLTLGKKEAQRDQQVILLDAAPTTYMNTTYVPLRFVTEALGYKVHWNKNDNSATLLKTFIETKNFVFDANQMTLSMKTPENKLIPIASNISISHMDWITINEVKTHNNHYLVSIINTYGEPHINDDVLVYYIADSKIIDSSTVHYWRTNVSNHQNYSNHMVALTDGKKLKLYDDTTLNLKKVLDLNHLLSQSIPDEYSHLSSINYAIEGVGKNVILVRGGTGALTLIDLETDEIIELYKKLLSPSELQSLQGNVPFLDFGDGLVFKKQEGNKLSFISSFFGNKEVIYELSKP